VGAVEILTLQLLFKYGTIANETMENHSLRYKHQLLFLTQKQESKIYQSPHTRICNIRSTVNNEE